ncbi:MAG TPA: hypothetical protein VD866_06165 [Urbifossiella sp.]|nr:hypothetical protein [Urbifossiella sp.]
MNPPAMPHPAQSFGYISTQASADPDTPGAVRLTRTLDEKVAYVETPAAVGQGLRREKWVRNLYGGERVYTLTADAEDLAAARPLTQWRAELATDLPGGPVNRKSPAVARVAAFARALLAVTAGLHDSRWRLGLTGPNNLYVVERPGTPTAVFLPDLGTAWVGQTSLAATSWLKGEKSDAALWGDESRLSRQLAAPVHYGPSFRPENWGELVQRDIKLVGRLIRYALAGDVSATVSPGSCPVWAVLDNAEKGKFVDSDGGSAAENFKQALLSALRAPVEERQGNGGVPPKPGISLPVLIAAVLFLAAAGVGGWYGYSKYKADTPVVAVDPEPIPPIQPPPIPPIPPPPQTVKELEKAWEAATTPIERGRLADQIAKLVPDHRYVGRSRAELLDEIRKTYAIAQNKGHVPLTSRVLYDLYKQLPEAP